MEVTINQVILHLLDPGASEPMLSDRAMEMDADLFEYFTAVLEKAFASDEVKNCRFLPDSAFAAEMAPEQRFCRYVRAELRASSLSRCCSIQPSRRAIWPWWILTTAAVPHYGVLKLNYRPGYTHNTQVLGNGQVQQHGAPAHAAARHPQGRRSRADRPRQRRSAVDREEVHASTTRRTFTCPRGFSAAPRPCRRRPS